MAQIEPIEIYGKENKGVYLKVYFSINDNCRLRAEILDAFDNVLSTSWVTAKTIEDVAQKLGLKLKNYKKWDKPQSIG